MSEGTHEPLDEFDLLQIVSQIEADTGLTLMPDHPPMVQDENGAWWCADVTEEQREQIREMIRHALLDEDEDD